VTAPSIYVPGRRQEAKNKAATRPNDMSPRLVLLPHVVRSRGTKADLRFPGENANEDNVIYVSRCRAYLAEL